MKLTGDDIHDARGRLGEMWGLSRPLHMSEMARALQLGGRDPGATIRDYERGKTSVSGPVSVAVQMMLAGSMPPDPLDEILRGGQTT